VEIKFRARHHAMSNLSHWLISTQGVAVRALLVGGDIATLAPPEPDLCGNQNFTARSRRRHRREARSMPVPPDSLLDFHTASRKEANQPLQEEVEHRPR
jgi:hypothetical protein